MNLAFNIISDGFEVFHAAPIMLINFDETLVDPLTRF
jgi:hypothetical protein